MGRLPAPEGPGSACGAPHLPEGFAGTFTSRPVDAGDLRQHVVTGGGRPPLLLVHGWPQTWYAWRLVVPALARDFCVVAPDQRGCGLSGKPPGGYDTGTLTGDLVTLAIGGAEGISEGAGNTMKLAADDVQTLVVPGAGHYCLEEAPDEIVAALTAFLAPYRDGPGRGANPRPHAVDA